MREHVQIASEAGLLDATFERGAKALGLVLFIHGSGSGRGSPRNEFLAGAMRKRGFATMLIDLLTDEEAELDARTGWNRYDIDRLANRLRCATAWLRADRRTEGMPLALYGASTGAAAALVLASERNQHVRAVVSRGGRPDLAGAAIPLVRAPTLLIVGSKDTTILALNQRAYEKLTAPADFMVIPGAGHRFEEPGALEEVASLSGRWLERHFVGTMPGTHLETPPHVI